MLTFSIVNLSYALQMYSRITQMVEYSTGSFCVNRKLFNDVPGVLSCVLYAMQIYATGTKYYTLLSLQVLSVSLTNIICVIY